MKRIHVSRFVIDALPGLHDGLKVLIISKRIRHGGHPVLRWMAHSVSLKQDPARNPKPDQAKSTGRIDGIVALNKALGRRRVNPAAGSAYGNNGAFVWVLEDRPFRVVRRHPRTGLSPSSRGGNATLRLRAAAVSRESSG